MKPRAATIQVLSVEDDPADSELIRQALRDYGHPALELTQAASLAAALAAMQARFFHLVITDLNLPDDEGLRTLSDLRKASPESTFVVVTGVDDRIAGVQALRAGAQDYLMKGDLFPQRVWSCLRNALVRQGILRAAKASVRRLSEANAHLHALARVDPLTGLYNRRGFDERLDGEWSRHGSEHGAVLLIDLDDFKRVNDRLGHDKGDLALQEVGRRLQARLRPGDFAARVGGDEFMVLLSDTRLEGATEIAERIRKAVEEDPVTSPDGPFRVTVSVGVAKPARQDLTAHQLLGRTHQALWMSKHGGKNRVSFEGAAAELEPSWRPEP
jgi:diguanylate cyclase (GGDEF)-like protein